MNLFTASGVRSLSRISVLFMFMHPVFQPDLTKKDAKKAPPGCRILIRLAAAMPSFDFYLP